MATERLDALSYGDDSTPLCGKVPEPPPSHWGKLTSLPRTACQQYQQFLRKHKEGRDGKQ